MRVTKRSTLFCSFVSLVAVMAVANASVEPSESDDTSAVGVVRDVAYAAVDGVEPALLSLDVYMPRATDDTVSGTKHPMVVYVHGGGWRRGDKGRVGKKAELFTGLGAVFVSVNYRLVPEGFHPVNAMDVASAVAYVQSHADEWGGDGDQLLLIGHSAGAHLAALVAAAPELLVDAGADPQAVRGCVVLDTQALDVERMMQSGGTANPLYAAAFGDQPELWRDASPYWRLQPDSSVPPFLLVVAGNNPRKLDQARRFVERLRTVGSEGVVIEAPEHTHKTLNQQLGADGDGVTSAVVELFTDPEGMVAARVAQRELAEPGPFTWAPSLTFDAASAADPLEAPLPNVVLNLTTHRGRLYAGAGATFEAMQYSGGRASVFVKPTADADWQVDQIFDQRTFRVGAMASVRFARGADGEEIPGGPIDRLMAAVLHTKASPEGPFEVWVRDDASDSWLQSQVTAEPVRQANVRSIVAHRDAVTGVDMVFVGANPAPLGIFSGVYDPEVSGGIRWSSEPELSTELRGGAGKWFGMASVNGVLLASTARAIYRRVDGPQPRWIEVMTGVRGGDLRQTEIRGLTAVPNPRSITGWPEEQMLLYASRMQLWRMRVPADPEVEHLHTAEIDLPELMRERTGAEVFFCEAAFNALQRFVPFMEEGSGEGQPLWPVGFQLAIRKPDTEPRPGDASSVDLPTGAWYLLRTRNGAYTLHRIVDPYEPKRVLFLVRDFESSPFPEERGRVMYAAGFNESYFKGSLASGWVYRGEWRGMPDGHAHGALQTTDVRVVGAEEAKAALGALTPEDPEVLRVIERFDSDGDLQISCEEAEGDDYVRRHFDRFDLDGNGKISAEEAAAALNTSKR